VESAQKNRKSPIEANPIRIRGKPIRFRWPLETLKAKAYWIIFDLIFVTNAVWIYSFHTSSSHFHSWLNHLVTWFSTLWWIMCKCLPKSLKGSERYWITVKFDVGIRLWKMVCTKYLLFDYCLKCCLVGLWNLIRKVATYGHVFLQLIK